MKAVFSQAISARNVLIDGVRRNVLGNRLVELRVEAGNVRTVGKLLEARLHNLERTPVVQWREVAKLLNCLVRILVDDLNVFVISSMHDPVAYKGEVVFAAHFVELVVVHQFMQDRGKRGIVTFTRLTRLFTVNDGFSVS